MMSVNNPFTRQQAVRVQPSVDDIFKLYVSNRLRRYPGFDEEINLFLYKLIVNMEKSVSLSSDQQLTCLEELSKLEIYQRTEQVHLNLESFQSMNVVLCNKIASMFQDGEITWQKIFQILDAVSEVIANIPEMVYLVDQLCHYSETIHVSSGGQTIGEWISSADQLHHYSETIPMSSEGQTTGEWMSSVDQLHHYNETIPMSSEGQTIGEWISSVGQELHQSFEEESSWIQEINISTESDQGMVEEPLETPKEYTTKCPCGSTVFWSIIRYKQCEVCRKHPCLIDGCSKAFESQIYVRQHLKTGHTIEEQQAICDKRRQYEDGQCARCGAPSPARGVSAHTECLSCKRFICLRGHCRAFFPRFHELQTHQAKCLFFFPQNKCGFCGGEKIKKSGQFTKCPNAICRAFWCGWCDFECSSTRSFHLHQRAKHRHITNTKHT